MIKFHKYISFIIGISFLVTLQEFSNPQPVFRFLLPAFVIFLALICIYNYWYVRAINKYNPWVLLRPVLLLASAFAIFLIIPNSFLRGWFLIITAVLIAFFEYFLGNFSENIALNETLIIAFGWFISLTAYNYPYFPAFHFLYIIGICVATFLTTRSFYEFIPQSDQYKFAASLAIALFCTEIFWALSFLPFHYSALALLLFNIFYFFLILNYHSAFNTLTMKKIQFHFILMVICSFVVIAATPWKILD